MKKRIKRKQVIIVHPKSDTYEQLSRQVPIPTDSKLFTGEIGTIKFSRDAKRHRLQRVVRPQPQKRRQVMEGRILTCVYCGHEYPQDTPAHGDKVLTDHIAGCEKHPMRAVIEQRDKLRDALAGMIGASTKEELDAMELGVRSLPGCEEDRAVALNAIHALRACAA